VRCAPPENQPRPAERDACAHWLEDELAALPQLHVIVALGGFAWTAALAWAQRCGLAVGTPKPRFGHGAQTRLGGGARSLLLLGSYHPSQQNTFTGKLTEPMLDAVLARAVAEAGLA
jgi:uracil-DNA glycosylase